MSRPGQTKQRHTVLGSSPAVSFGGPLPTSRLPAASTGAPFGPGALDTSSTELRNGRVLGPCFVSDLERVFFSDELQPVALALFLSRFRFQKSQTVSTLSLLKPSSPCPPRSSCGRRPWTRTAAAPQRRGQPAPAARLSGAAALGEGRGVEAVAGGGRERLVLEATFESSVGVGVAHEFSRCGRLRVLLASPARACWNPAELTACPRATPSPNRPAHGGA